MSTTHAEATSGGPGRDPLLRAEWQYIEKSALNEFTLDEWALLKAQRAEFNREYQADAVLAVFSLGARDKVFGYQVNQYRHGLNTASMLLRDGYDEEDVVVGLLHDIGFVICPKRHGAFAAELLGPYISERNEWMLRHHEDFGSFPYVARGMELSELPRERWRGHPYFDWTLTFVEEYDQNSMSGSYDHVPLEDFVPMVHRLFAREPRQLTVD